MKPEIDYTLYLVTDRTLMSSATLTEAVKEAVKGGCTLVQLREKTLSSNEFYQTAVEIRKITTQLKVPLIINDRVDIALAVDAEGVHIGQDDLPAQQVRRLIGPGKIMGVSASNLQEALDARDAGADYLGVGAMYATGTKSDAAITTVETLKHICKAVDLPVVAIGGLNRETIPNLAGTGIDGLAVVSAVIAQKDPTKAAKELKSLFLKGN